MKHTNCPNCGAPITNYICDYCGTILEEPEIDEYKLYANDEIIETVRKTHLDTYKTYNQQIEEYRSKLAQLELEALQTQQTSSILNQINVGMTMNYDQIRQVSPAELEEFEKRLIESSVNVFPHVSLDNDEVIPPELENKFTEINRHLLWWFITIMMICILWVLREFLII